MDLVDIFGFDFVRWVGFEFEIHFLDNFYLWVVNWKTVFPGWDHFYFYFLLGSCIFISLMEAMLSWTFMLTKKKEKKMQNKCTILKHANINIDDTKLK